MKFIPEYRVWAGFAVWGLFILADILTLGSKPERLDGYVQLTGFLIALGWALYD